MSLSLQPSVTSAPLNGLLAQPIEGASSQPLSFEEVLKVEEKKLQQTINTQSVAALLATIQQPAMPESIHGFDAGNLADSANSVDQPALTTDSVQPATTQPKQNLQLHNQQSALPEKAAAKIQTDFSMPDPEIKGTDQHQHGKTQSSLQLKEVKTSIISETQDQISQPIAENRLPSPTSVSNTQAVSTSTKDAEKTGVKISVRKDDSSSTPVQPGETKSAPALTHTVEKVGQPSLSQPDLSEASTNAPITQPFTSNVTIQSESMPLTNQTRKVFVADAKPVEADEENTSAFQVLLPAAKTQSENSPVSLKREFETGSLTPKAVITSSLQNEISLPERVEPLQRGRVVSETTQMNATVTETSQSESKTNIRVEKSISLDGVEENQSKPVSVHNETEPGDHFKNAILSNASSPSVAKTQQAFPQNENVMPEVSFAAKDSETAQPVETPESPISEVSHSNKVNLVSVEDKEINTQQKPFVEYMESTLSTDAHIPAERTAATIKSDKQVSAAVKMDIPVQVNIPEGENPQSVQVAVAPNMKLDSPTISNEPAITESTMATQAQANTFPSEISRPAKAKMTVPVQADVLETEMSQPVKESIAPAIKSAAPEINNEPETGNIPTSEKPQPVKETVVRNVKSASVETTNDFSATEIKTATQVQIEALESETPQSAKETFSPNAKSVQSAQTDIPVAEVSLPAKETVVQTVKSAAPEINNTLSKSVAKGIGQVPSEISTSEQSQPTKKLVFPSAETTSVQADALANESSQPVKETVVQSLQPAIAKLGDEQSVTKKIAVPVQPEVPASEVSQPVEETASSSVESERTLPSDDPDTTKMKIVTSVQSETPASEMQQPVKETTAPSVRPLMVEPALAKVKIDFPVQAEVPASEVSQPVEETASSSVKSVSAEQDETKMKVAAPAQPDDSTNEASNPAKETVAPSARSVVTEPDMTKVKTAAFVQLDIPASEVPQFAKETVIPSVKPAMTEPDAATTKIDFSMQLDVPASEISQPVNPLMPERDATKKIAVPVESEINDEVHATRTMMAAPMEADVPASEVSQPVKETVVPTVKAAASETGDEPIATEKKMAVQVKDVSVSEMSQPAKETMAPTVKAAAFEISEEPIKAEKKMTAPVQEKDVSASEISQPAKEIVVPTVKAAASETGDEPIAIEKKMTAPVQVENVSASEMSQPAKEIVALTVKAAASETGDEPIKAEKKMAVPVQVEDVSASEMSQPAKETMLKSKDDKATLEFDNATAESLLKMGNMPQIKNEAFVVEQKNASAEIKAEKVHQSAHVEIKSEEKVMAKEPALDLESNVVIAETDKGMASVSVVKNSSAAALDPMARDVVEQITSHVKARIKSGETSIHMKLSPEKLGEIEVQMTRTSQGVSVSFVTEQASTGQLIESQVNQLRQSLKDAGVQLANLNINQHGQSHQEGGGFRQSQQFVQTSRRDVPLVEDAGTQPQHVGLTSEIDYLV